MASEYNIIRGILYKRGLSTPLLKCLGKEEVAYTHLHVHEGIGGKYLGVKELAKTILGVGYFWTTMVQDAKEYMKKYDQCQHHGDIFNASSTYFLCFYITMFIHVVGIGYPWFIRPNIGAIQILDHSSRLLYQMD